MKLERKSYPRLLLLTSSTFNLLSGGGICFTNLFRCWPKDKIATAHSDKIQPSNVVCEKYYFLGSDEFPWSFPFSVANIFSAQDKIENTLKFAKGSPTHGSLKGKSGFVNNVLRSILPFIQRIIGDDIPTDAKLTSELKAWIVEFKPEVIYTILGSLQYIRLVRQISKEFKIPYVIHMMDDWQNVLYRKGIFGSLRRKTMQSELKELIDGAAVCMAICPAMAKEYEKRYGRAFLAFHNALDAKDWLKKARNDWQRTSPFKMIYGGALMQNSQVESVRDACDAVESLFKKGLDIQFDIYAPWYSAARYRAELERMPCVRVFDAPETMDIESVFANADLLLLPVNFDKNTVEYVKYSMPNKIPAYMFSGTPTLAYGSASVASIKYAKEWAYCVTAKDKTILADAIKMLAADEELRARLGRKAQELAAKNHDSSHVRPAFHNAIIQAIKQ